MKKTLFLLCALSMLGGCAYQAVATSSGDRVVIAKNNAFLFGAFNSVYVCKVTDGGVTKCSKDESP